MAQSTIVQFVSFETILDVDEFIVKWEQYNRSSESDLKVVLQQSQLDTKSYRYLAQHRIPTGDFHFTFSKGKKTSRLPEVEIRTRQIGGYIEINGQRKNNLCLPGENKLFAFINSPYLDMEEIGKIFSQGSFNVYEAFYESCQYRYILEYFAEDEQLRHALGLLKAMDLAGFGLYKECLVKSL